MIHQTGYCGTSFSLFLCRSERLGGVTYRRGALAAKCPYAEVFQDLDWTL
jgi:hypothetical protein